MHAASIDDHNCIFNFYESEHNYFAHCSLTRHWSEWVDDRGRGIFPFSINENVWALLHHFTSTLTPPTRELWSHSSGNTFWISIGQFTTIIQRNCSCVCVVKWIRKYSSIDYLETLLGPEIWLHNNNLTDNCTCNLLHGVAQCVVDVIPCPSYHNNYGKTGGSSGKSELYTES